MRSTIATAAVGPALERLAVENDGQFFTGYSQRRLGVIRPAIVGAVDNYAPAGIGTARIVVFTITAGFNITGLDITQWPVGQRDGVVLDWYNAETGAGPQLQWQNENAASLDLNRFITAGAVQINQSRGGRIRTWYDQAAQGGVGRWRVGT